MSQKTLKADSGLARRYARYFLALILTFVFVASALIWIHEPIVRRGNPKDEIVEEAQSWGAGCVFVGAKGMRGVDRLLMGSVSSAVSARAHCSVEVVRVKAEDGGNS